MTAPVRGLSACHNHTQMSDGALALDDMVRAAVRQGFSDIGISDHSCLAAEPPHATGDEAGYLAALRGAKARFAGRICVAAGLELDALSHFSARHELDYVIGSVHYLYDKAADRFYGVDWDEDTAQSCIKEMFGQNGLAYAKAYYAAVAENALRTRPDVIGHFDLVVKPNARGALFDEESPAYRAAALEALDACCEAGGILEVNTGGVFRGWRSTFYPAPFLLRRAAEKGMRATVNADAHCAEALCFGFAPAREMLRQAGFSSVWVLRGGAFCEEAL